MILLPVGTALLAYMIGGALDEDDARILVGILFFSVFALVAHAKAYIRVVPPIQIRWGRALLLWFGLFALHDAARFAGSVK
jgi:hypothetical protein